MWLLTALVLTVFEQAKDVHDKSVIRRFNAVVSLRRNVVNY